MSDTLAAHSKKVVLWVAAIVTATMGIYPPWTQEYARPFEDAHFGPTAARYSWIFRKPGAPAWTGKYSQVLPGDKDNLWTLADRDFWNDRVDAIRLLIQWAVVWTLTGVSLYTLSRRTEGLPAVTPAEEGPRPAKAASSPLEAESPAVARVRTSEFLEACLTAVAADSALGKELWRNLLLKVGHDKHKAVRLVQFEIDELKRSALPEESFVALMQRAIERWERENRG